MRATDRKAGQLFWTARKRPTALEETARLRNTSPSPEDWKARGSPLLPRRFVERKDALSKSVEGLVQAYMAAGSCLQGSTQTRRQAHVSMDETVGTFVLL